MTNTAPTTLSATQAASRTTLKKTMQKFTPVVICKNDKTKHLPEEIF
jgi:hypothetical protein